jgi:integrase
LPGFGVRVKPTGAAAYLIQYRNSFRATRRYAFAKTAEYKLEAARRKAAKLLGSIKDGADPSADRKANLRADTVRELCDRFLSDHAEVHAKPSYLAEQRRIIETKIKPALGMKPIRAATRADVQALHLKLRKTPYEANRVLAALSVIFKMAEHWKLRDEGTNPARGVARYREKRRERLLTDAEVTRIYKAMREAERTRTMADAAILAIRLLFSTACRAGEILGFKRDYIDHDNGDIVWPDSKTGHMRKPLTKETAALLDDAEVVVGNPYVCVGTDRTKPLSISTLEAAWRKLLKTAEVEHCGLHAIRHRAATDIANDSTIPLHVGMKLTGHKTPATFFRYLHANAEQARKAAEKVSRQRQAIIKRPAASVISLPQRTR